LVVFLGIRGSTRGLGDFGSGTQGFGDGPFSDND